MSSAGALERLAGLVPGAGIAARYQRRWLWADARAALVLTAVLIPVGMGYAQASGLPAYTGLYATIVPMLAYAVFGPSRILVLAPDSALAPILLVTITPLAAGDGARAVALAGLLSIMVGVLLVLGGVLRLGFVTDLLSMPIRTGFLNALALLVLASQLPGLVGIDVDAADPLGQVTGTVAGLAAGAASPLAAALGVGTLTVILGFRLLPVAKVTGTIVAVVAAVGITVLFGLQDRVPVVGEIPRGLPAPALGGLGWPDVGALAWPAVGVALIAFADSIALSRAYSARQQEDVGGNQEMAGLGLANIAGGLFGGFAVSASGSRTPVAEQSGARTQLAHVLSALLIMAFMLLAPGATRYLPEAVLAAVVMVAALSLLDVGRYLRLWRMDRVDAALSTATLLGVFLVGVLEGLGLAIGLAFVAFVVRAWRPYRTELGLVSGLRGYHDLRRHPEATRVPGILILRFDAPLFFVNAGLFNQWVRRCMRRVVRQVKAAGGTPPTTLVLAAEPITDVDTTAAEELADLDDWLAGQGVTLLLAELKGPVKDSLARYGMAGRFGPERFPPTVGAAVDAVTGRLRADIDETPEERMDLRGEPG
ncbi:MULTISPECIES: SulP family inorganic anion transporter [Citricoccus]|uniref:SulP family inorganic anion transporter n=1 Tax=Citricoccus TaxID=169133 RepID=UPI000255F5EC|nr:SulP family inorganic anion transporter [Citricoccus sp. CH26A]